MTLTDSCRAVLERSLNFELSIVADEQLDWLLAQCQVSREYGRQALAALLIDVARGGRPHPPAPQPREPDLDQMSDAQLLGVAQRLKDAGGPVGLLEGKHRHYCPRCDLKWSHATPGCAQPVTLPCPLHGDQPVIVTPAPLP